MAGRNGFEKFVKLEEAQKGDLVLMNWPGGNSVDHVGIAADRYRGNGLLATVEGNTSSGPGGSQSNGGGVFKRTRARSEIVGIARPRW
jgi:cell wall-associated NlpC family hydrolase